MSAEPVEPRAASVPEGLHPRVAEARRALEAARGGSPAEVLTALERTSALLAAALDEPASGGPPRPADGR